MKSTVKLCITVILLAVVCLSSSGCKLYKEYLYEQPIKEYPELFSVLACSVPGTGDRYTRAGKIQVLETDSYGRTLFKLVQPVTVYYDTNELCAVVICQKSSGEGAYYFRDVNFALADGDGNVSESRIEALKERNRWEQPLDINADDMQFTPVFTFDRFVNNPDLANGYYLECGVRRRSKLVDDLRKYYPGLFPSTYVSCYDVYDDGKAIYIASNTANTSASHFKCCLLATYPDGKLYEESPVFVEAPFTEEFYQQIVQFRADFEAAATEHKVAPNNQNAPIKKPGR